MCGIAGILKFEGAHRIGHDLFEMATCLQHRGADSAGVAVFTSAPDSAPHEYSCLQVALPAGAPMPDETIILALGANRLSDICIERGGFFARLNDDAPVAILSAPVAISGAPIATSGAPIATRHQSNSLADAALVRRLEEALPGATVSSLGRRMRVHKTVGRVEELESQMDSMSGTHGIAHLRLATESRIDPAHAQPFWGRPYSDIAVTHNGHITNYLKLRKQFEARGFSFASHNDSEIIGVFLGDKMEGGMTFLESLQAAGHELDGSFSFIAATANALGVARDALATKPLLFVENEAGIALASEPQALYRVLGPDIAIREIKPKETRVWELA